MLDSTLVVILSTLDQKMVEGRHTYFINIISIGVSYPTGLYSFVICNLQRVR